MRWCAFRLFLFRYNTMSDAVVRERISESKLHSFKGKFPDVPTYPHVDTELLYQGDAAPFHITLAIAKVGEISGNGLVYDEELVTAIESQLPGLGGIRGHQREDDLSYGFPFDAVDWIGSVRVGETLWAKGYVPPSDTREDIRRRMARGAGIGTSVFGDALRETLNGGKWRAKEFKLDSLDLGKPGRVARRVGSGAFKITSEFMEEDNSMGDTNITLNDVPQSVREQIVREAQVHADAARVGELNTRISELQNEKTQLETQVTEAKQQVAEAATYKTICTEIQATIGKDTDTVQIVTEYHLMATKLAELMGVPYTNITVKIQEMHESLAEFKTKAFEGSVDAKISELTNWNVTKDENKVKVANFRKGLKRAVLSELKGATEDEKVTETLKTLWADEYQSLGESLVKEFGGPSAIVGGKGNQLPAQRPNQQQIDEARARTGI